MHKSEKTFRRYMYIDGCAKFLVIFVQRYFTLVKINNLRQKQKQRRFKFVHILYTRYLISFQVIWKTNFTKSFKIGRVSPSLYQACTWRESRGQSSQKLLGFNHIKEQNQHSESPLFFFWGFFSSILLLSFFLPSVFFSGSGTPVLPWISKPCKVGLTSSL